LNFDFRLIMANRAPDFFRQLNEQLLEQLEEFARQPGRQGDELLQWLEEHGVKTSRSAVYRWLQDFRLEDRTQRASQVARSYLEAARQSDPTAVSQAALQKFQELLFDKLVETDELSTGDLMKLSIAMKTGLNAQQIIGELKTRFDQAAKALTDGRRAITNEDIAAVRKAVFG
jgi:hypothetical protein